MTSVLLSNVERVLWQPTLCHDLQYSMVHFKNLTEDTTVNTISLSPISQTQPNEIRAATYSDEAKLRLCHLNHEYPYLGLLNSHNTRTEGWQTSPAQWLFGFRMKISAYLTAKWKSGTEADRIKASNKRIGDTKKSKDLRPLQFSVAVHVQPITPDQRRWSLVVRPLSRRTYEVGRTTVLCSATSWQPRFFGVWQFALLMRQYTFLLTESIIAYKCKSVECKATFCLQCSCTQVEYTDWKLVFLHRPIYSFGAGHHPTCSVVRDLVRYSRDQLLGLLWLAK